MTTGPDWGRVKQIFQEALDLPPDERLPRARAQCEHDPAVLAEVESLLAAHQDAGSFAERPADELLAALPSEPRDRSTDAVTPLLTEGTRLGVYEIQSLLGAGGMGEIYCARDTRLDRTVAIKVLRVAVGHDRTRERFEREARAVAALSHPNICTLHDIGHDDGIDFLVMEHLAGETLASRLSRGPLPVDQAMDLAIQIASALETAHRAGVVHRDLKPGNIFLTHTSGPSKPTIAKLLDFGLAKLQQPLLTGAAGPAAPSSSLTTPGLLVGTVRYMAPEQIEGKPADARTDIFAFGAVIYEAIAGRRAFDGPSDVHVMAAILEHVPAPLTMHQPLAPAFLDRVLVTCLAKNPDDRWQTARDLLRALAWARDGEAPARLVTVPSRFRLRRSLSWVAALIIAGLAGTAMYSSWWGRPAARPAIISFSIAPPQGTRFPRGAASMAVSPDGTRLVFVALSNEGTPRLWVRRFDSVSSRLLAGSDGAASPFWSPDGRFIGFFAHGKLKRMAESDGSAQVISDDAPYVGRGGAWSRSGTIVFTGEIGPLRRVADTGGRSTPVTAIDASRKERAHMWPVFAPDGRRFLYLARSDDRALTSIYQGSLDSAATHRLLAAESSPILMGKYLLALSNQTLLARLYEPDGRPALGEPVTVAEHIESDSALRWGGGVVAAADGVLAYRSASPNSLLVWFDRRGSEIGRFHGPGDYQHPWLAPDEDRVAVEKTDAVTGRHTIWSLDFRRGLTSRLVSDASGAHGPVWSPDGSRVIFSSNRLGGVDLYSADANNPADEALVLSSPQKEQMIPTDWSRDGRLLIYQIDHRGQQDLWTMSASLREAARPFLKTAANERQGQFSPDSRWMAYTSDESGTPEVYVRRYPEADAKWQVSIRGGAQPRWRHDGKELFYLAPDGRLMATDVTVVGSHLKTGPPYALFNTGITASFVDRRNQYVVTRDGQRFLVNISAEDENSAPITVVLNWNGGKG